MLFDDEYFGHEYMALADQEAQEALLCEAYKLLGDAVERSHSFIKMLTIQREMSKIRMRKIREWRNGFLDLDD